MKCKQCGAPITIEDEFCPFCGALNLPARRHIEDMKRFSKDYADTKAEVFSNVAAQSRRHGRIIVLVVLIFVNLALLIFNLQVPDLSYRFRDAYLSAYTKSHAGELQTKMTQLETQGDYQEMPALYYGYSMYLLDGDVFGFTVSAMEQYAAARGAIFELHDNPQRYDEDDSYQLRTLADNLSRLFAMREEVLSAEPGRYDYPQLCEPHRSAILELADRCELLLRTEFGFTREEVGAMREWSATDLMLAIAEKEKSHETDK